MNLFPSHSDVLGLVRASPCSGVTCTSVGSVGSGRSRSLAETTDRFITDKTLPPSELGKSALGPGSRRAGFTTHH